MNDKINELAKGVVVGSYIMRYLEDDIKEVSLLTSGDIEKLEQSRKLLHLLVDGCVEKILSVRTSE